MSCCMSMRSFGRREWPKLNMADPSLAPAITLLLTSSSTSPNQAQPTLRNTTHETQQCPLKGAIRGTGVGRPAPPRGYAQQVYTEITNPENRSVVTSIAFFVVCHLCISGWGSWWEDARSYRPFLSDPFRGKENTQLTSYQ